MFAMLGDEAVRAPSRPEPGQVLAGKYRIERELGHGGMGVVYGAKHRVTGRRVAIKWLLSGNENAAAIERFLREAQAVGRIEHPNVVQVLDVGDDARGPFIVMEFLNGEPLSSLLSRMRLRPTDAVDLLMPALRGVHAAHAEGVVHRDLKPENIFLCRDRDGAPLEAKVLDFGISKLTFDNAPVNTLTRPGALIGTPHYMAPERVRGHFDSDPRTDVYAFGVILYEVLTGMLPFDSKHFGELIARISTEAPRPPRSIDPSIPAALQSVVLKAMARRIEDRYPDIESLGLALEPFAGEQRFKVQRRDPTGAHCVEVPSGAPTLNHDGAAGVPADNGTLDPVTTVAPPPYRRPQVRIALAALAAAVVVGGAVVALWPDDAGSHPGAQTSAAVSEAAAPAIPTPASAALVEADGPTTEVAGAQLQDEASPGRPTPVEERGRKRAQAEAEAAEAHSAAMIAPERTRTAASREHKTRPRTRVVAKGVRTRGMSEQEF